LAGRDLVGIAATGSGSHSFVLCLSSLLWHVNGCANETAAAICP
jgi:hypothetical protein